MLGEALLNLHSRTLFDELDLSFGIHHCISVATRLFYTLTPHKRKRGRHRGTIKNGLSLVLSGKKQIHRTKNGVNAFSDRQT